MKKLISLATFVLIGGISCAAFNAVSAFDMSSHYKNKRMTILIPYGPGGTYDKYGSTFARHLGGKIPGNPTVIVQHMPGAGGAKAMNFAFNVMQKRGYNAIVPLDNSVVNQLLRPKKMRWKTDKFNWIGSSNQTNVIMAIRTDTGVKTLMDMKRIPIIGSTSGVSSSGYLSPMLMAGLFGLKIKMITGYKGSSRSILAMEQGESQMAAFNWLAWDSKVPHWFAGKKPFARVIMQTGVFEDPDLPGVPMLGNLVKTPEHKAVVAFLASAGPIGRGLTLPPGTPKGVIAGLQKAYDKMNADPKFAKELKKRRLRLMASSGKTIQEVVDKVLRETSPAVIKLARKIIGLKTL